MRKFFAFCAIAQLAITATAIAQVQCPPNPNPYYNGYCPGLSNSDSVILTFNINPINFIELHDHALEFSNCGFAEPCSGGGFSALCTCVSSSLSAATNQATCQSPKKIIGQLDAPMPCCTALGVAVDAPTYSCGYGTGYCGLSYEQGCQTPGFCGDANGDPRNVTCGEAVDLITCITCGFSDCDIGITYYFCADICAQVGSFQRTFTLSIVDDAGPCYNCNPQPPRKPCQ